MADVPGGSPGEGSDLRDRAARPKSGVIDAA